MGRSNAASDVSGQLDAIAAGKAFARPPVRIVRIAGPEAAGWLHDLVTTDVVSLVPGQARRSLMLTPTGRIRADFMVARDAAGFRLLQDLGQPAIDRILGIYVLSAAVEVLDEGPTVAMWTLVADAKDLAPETAGGTAPSLLGPGRDLVAPSSETDPPWIGRGGSEDLAAVDAEALEIWRIRRGDPKMGVDFDEGALPAEVGLDGTIDTTKGCFLGQESVAKIRNLGHPPHRLRHLRSRGTPAVGMPVLAGGTEVGTVTSLAPAEHDGFVDAIVCVGWRARDADLTAADGSRFLDVSRQD